MKTLPDQEPRRTKRDAVATKAAIVAAALEEFADLGLAGARIDEIARSARVNKALLYYYFESKEHLYQGVVEQMFVAMTGALRAALGTADGPREKLLAFLDANFKVLAGQARLCAALGAGDGYCEGFLEQFEARYGAQVLSADCAFVGGVQSGA